MSNSKNSGGKPSRLLMTVLAALIISAISLFYLNFSSSRESGKQKPNPPQKAVYTEPHAAYFHPESSEVVQDFQSVKDDVDPAKSASKVLAFVRPPIPAFKPEAVSCIMDNASGGTITCESGSIAVIPPNAFVDAKGKPVKDKVKVSFTEYRDYKDIFFSGIPMTYTENNKTGQFESAGMMQLEASTDNGQVYMTPGKLVRVMLATNDQRQGYDLYFFNKKTGSWEEKGKDKIVYKKKDLQRSIPARVMAPFKQKQRAVYITSFEGIPEDRVFLWWRSPGKDFDFSFIKLNKSYPELKSLSGMKWEYQGTDAKEVYKKLFNVAEKDKNRPVRRGYWQSYTAVMNPQEASITLTFVNEEEEVPVTIRPKDRNEKNLLKVRQRMERYEKAHANRIDSDQEEYAKYQKDSAAYSYPQETLASVKMDVMRSFTIDNFGIWNCDRVLSNENFISYTLKFYDQNNQMIIPTEVYFADKNYNSVFTFYPTYSNNTGRTSTACDIRLDPFSNCMLWMVLPDGKLAVAGKDEIWKLAGKKGSQKITMQVSNDALASIEQARERLNF